MKAFVSVAAFLLLGYSVYPVDTVTVPQETEQIEEYEVTKIVDGDTIKIIYQNKTISVRMIGIDTPESYKYRTGYIECYGKEASDAAKHLIKVGSRVGIQLDHTQAKLDKYGRLLAHVYVNGKSFQEVMIREGMGFHFVYDKKSSNYEMYSRAEALAKQDNLGVWKYCEGKRKAVD